LVLLLFQDFEEGGGNMNSGTQFISCMRPAAAHLKKQLTQRFCGKGLSSGSLIIMRGFSRGTCMK